MKSYALTLRLFIKQLITGLVAGTLAGAVILGLGGRLVMRLIAIIGGVKTGASLSGTLEIIAFGSLVGAASGLGYTLVKIILPRLPQSRWIKGILMGLLIYGILLLVPFESKLAARGFPHLQFLIHALFAGVCLIFGLILIPSIDKLQR